MYIPRRIVKRPSVRISLWIIVSMINSLPFKLKED